MRDSVGRRGLFENLKNRKVICGSKKTLNLALPTWLFLLDEDIVTLKFCFGLEREYSRFEMAPNFF